MSSVSLSPGLQVSAFSLCPHMAGGERERRLSSPFLLKRSYYDNTTLMTLSKPKLQPKAPLQTLFSIPSLESLSLKYYLKEKIYIFPCLSKCFNVLLLNFSFIALFSESCYYCVLNVCIQNAYVEAPTPNVIMFDFACKFRNKFGGTNNKQ